MEHAEDLARLEATVASYSRQLEVCDKEESPTLWARAQLNRAVAYFKLGTMQERDEDTEAAFDLALIGCDAALTVFPEGNELSDWQRAHALKPESTDTGTRRGTRIPHRSSTV